jgi:hypothetical protein
VLNKIRLIKFKKVVYFLKRIKKEFTKKVYKKLTIRYLKINKTREIITACYYFLLISRIVKQVVKEYNIYSKLKTTTRKYYKLLMLPSTLKEL